MKYVCPECGTVEDGPISHVTNDICGDCGVLMVPDSTLRDTDMTGGKSVVEAACEKHAREYGQPDPNCPDCDTGTDRAKNARSTDEL